MTDCRADKNGKSNGRYDLAVLGAGSAGFSAAITAAGLGARVALVGHGVIGGTCVNVGCVPSKTLIRAADALHQAAAAHRFSGIEARSRISDWRALIAQKDALVSDLRQAKYRDLLPAYANISYIEGEARLASGGVLVNGGLIEASRVIIATGARPALPSIPGIAGVEYLTSTSALDLAELPKSLLVLGGGYIGAELAQLFARAGVKVTIVARSRLLPLAEPEIAAALSQVFHAERIALKVGVDYLSCRQSNDGVALRVLRNGTEEIFEAERILIAAGRAPNVENLGMNEMGVAQAANGAINVDDRMRTSRPGVYAAGDVTGRDQFVYMAAYGAKIAAHNALNGDSRRYDASAMPAVVFTDPQLASVGLTEAEARAQGLEVRTSVLRLDQVPRALAARDTRGAIKLVAQVKAGSDKTGRLLGAHILAPEGADAIQTAALAIKFNMTAAALAETIFPYLTTVEGLKLAALGFEKDPALLSCCAG